MPIRVGSRVRHLLDDCELHNEFFDSSTGKIEREEDYERARRERGCGVGNVVADRPEEETKNGETGPGDGRYTVRFDKPYATDKNGRESFNMSGIWGICLEEIEADAKPG